MAAFFETHLEGWSNVSACWWNLTCKRRLQLMELELGDIELGPPSRLLARMWTRLTETSSGKSWVQNFTFGFRFLWLSAILLAVDIDWWGVGKVTWKGKP